MEGDRDNTTHISKKVSFLLFSSLSCFSLGYAFGFSLSNFTFTLSFLVLVYRLMLCPTHVSVQYIIIIIIRYYIVVIQHWTLFIFIKKNLHVLTHESWWLMRAYSLCRMLKKGIFYSRFFNCLWGIFMMTEWRWKIVRIIIWALTFFSKHKENENFDV